MLQSSPRRLYRGKHDRACSARQRVEKSAQRFARRTAGRTTRLDGGLSRTADKKQGLL